MHDRQSNKHTLQILTASYGPSEGRRLLDGTLVDYSIPSSYVPYTRDVRPFLAALLSHEHSLDENEADGGLCFCVDKNSVALMDGRSMNAVFGDPCQGTTKSLRVEYLFRDYFWSDEAENAANDSSGIDRGLNEIQPCSNRKRELLCTTSRVYQSTFAEHDRVLLKRQDVLFPLVADANEDKDMNDPSAAENSHINDTESTSDLLQSSDATNNLSVLAQSQSTISLKATNHINHNGVSSPGKSWRLAPNTSEITLPLILPYLTVRQRAKCQLVCSSWRYVVMERGIAVVIDINDTGLFPKDSNSSYTNTNFGTLSPFIPPSPSAPNERQTSLADTDQKDSSRALLRGLLTHSHSSLESLVLNDFISLKPLIDLHPTLPYLRKLKRLDISRIPTITDDTLNLISTFVGPRLEVLYMKGLRNISNKGVVHLVQSCTNLRVLDVSYLHQLEDEAGVAIGRHLTKLEVFHGRDNYKFTNASVDLITTNCKNLVQATFWGCIRLTHVFFGKDAAKDNEKPSSADANSNPLSAVPVIPVALPFNDTKIVLLNLWGCHGLRNSSASLLSSLPHLRSLCVSECHKLSDAFVMGITQSLTQLIHLQLRYLRRITDESLDAISLGLACLYSLDVSFCNKLTLGGLSKLLKERCDTLSELRLFSCKQLNLDGGSLTSNERNEAGGIGGGRRLSQVLKSVQHSSILSILDVRGCSDSETLVRDELFLQEMSNLHFEEELRGFFRKPAVWSGGVKRQLATTLCIDIGSITEDV